MVRKNRDYLLGIDAGTTLIKSVLFDLEGNIVAKADASVPLEHPKPGWAEQDMEAVWDSASKTIRQVVDEAKSLGGTILGLSVSGQGGGLWLVDQAGQPVRKAITWLDGRASDTLERWQESGVLSKLEELSSYHLFPGVGPITLFDWFKRFEPTVLEKSHKVLWAKDWIKLRLTGEMTTDETDPSNGHFLCGHREFSQEMLELAGITEYQHLLPPIVPSWQPAGTVTEKIAQETGLMSGTPVASGAWDVSSTALGAGCTQDGQTLTILGTAGIHLTVASNVADSERAAYSVCAHSVPGKWVINSMAMTATANLDWCIRELCKDDVATFGDNTSQLYEALNERIEAVPLGSRGIFFLPFLQGERAPFVKPEATALFFGLTNASQRDDLLRAIYEGVSYSTLHNYEAIETVTPIREVTLAGGGAKSVVWAQILADCTGKPMKVPAGEEFGARGAAMNAGVAVGAYPDHTTAAANTKFMRNHTATSEITEAYQKQYAIYKELIDALWKVWDHAAVQD